MSARFHVKTAQELREQFAELLAHAASLRRFGYHASADAMTERAMAVERRLWSCNPMPLGESAEDARRAPEGMGLARSAWASPSQGGARRPEAFV